ncbi:DMT family transporter [Acetobacterium sp.]|jgi:drug/metabolite transporter (DMT)-like permease|uniref:DMT family transporter n=1 Tax=Acetobacterium sp. TaxID=1872094 RepID=UPI000CCA6655|nr:DMT family transporter [Acetobacterium sp.]MDO9492374.1 DMT family transporter [Acetobacterium sp.]PKM74850.1 MAG: EamA family transporter [Firmicutes bacterium HGW-Firmicutes-17]
MKKNTAVVYAILAALLFGINAPFSKLLLDQIDPLFLAALLYLGAGMGMTVLTILSKKHRKDVKEARLTKKEMPYVVLMILLDIAAPIFLLMGISLTNSSTAALLGNFEIAATSVIAMIFFKEAIGKRMWIAIGFISLASILLTISDTLTINLSIGAVFVMSSCVCWGFENNCTQNLSIKDPVQVVILKGFGSGLGALLIAFIWGDLSGSLLYIILAMTLGFVAYGLSIFFYVKAQRGLGAARTSAYYAAAPFMGVLISWLVLQEPITFSFLIALVIMILGTWLALSENHEHAHIHDEETHEHSHNHDDAHHLHEDHPSVKGEHCHEHTHKNTAHSHCHLPDVHHRHMH